MGTGQDFARNLRTARERHGWSPTELARRCQAQGLTSFYAATVNRVESGARQIRLEEAPALANVFHLTVEQMMFDDSRFDVAMHFSVLVEQMTALADTLRAAGAAYEEARESKVASILVTAGSDDPMALTKAQRELLELFSHQTAGDVAMLGERSLIQTVAKASLPPGLAETVEKLSEGSVKHETVVKIVHGEFPEGSVKHETVEKVVHGKLPEGSVKP